MSKRTVNRAVRRYQAATTPAAIRSNLAKLKRIGLAGHVTAASLRADAAAELRDAVAAEANH
jgi:hypothetical protein